MVVHHTHTYTHIKMYHLIIPFLVVCVIGQLPDTRGDLEYEKLTSQLWSSYDDVIPPLNFLDPDLDDIGTALVKQVDAQAQKPREEVNADTMKRLTADPMYLVDRHHNRWVNIPMIEQGFWREVAIYFERIKQMYSKFIVETPVNKIPDRLIVALLNTLLPSKGRVTHV
eukprot:Blabericola_migrator_1__7632@NODE_38_length_17790_cov_195_231733_g34_i0_p9_GENE_NODE_38_length_17790_cov_195_231733_g34_i0NODE_38_length_17790_cov_195_231733_g34_i0_p9_ORF_typecomplete_len169_score31_86_NODE_38_length_17790_cov_195_231733_g34_i0954310049